ncbi:unnamed protein product [Litomosoides sigmodontis]|uniref:Myotubularin phosphatase domain-containing protein n=1 Tax=Litomosoides sigmodontis TaxID=42156 RepID=A0A3P6T5W1_LITSI|nr:unnamed protein product [Litomosoides sigmodontis]
MWSWFHFTVNDVPLFQSWKIDTAWSNIIKFIVSNGRHSTDQDYLSSNISSNLICDTTYYQLSPHANIHVLFGLVCYGGHLRHYHRTLPL